MVFRPQTAPRNARASASSTRYAVRNCSDFQNFAGETVGGYREVVHFICPRPKDVDPLMSGWPAMTERLGGSTDAVVAAAMVGFVLGFIHPFKDGNGRIHHDLVHHILSSEGFMPSDVLSPVSAAIVRDIQG